jgi:GTP pyrophosphokinase
MRIDDILEKVAKYAPDPDRSVIFGAYLIAAKAHEKQQRKDGTAYLNHPLEVADLLADLRMDVDTIATALLHDTIEDTLITQEELAAQFGTEIAQLVEGVTKIGKLQFRSTQEAAAENFRKMVLAMSQDIRVVLVKLADRLHNMRTLGVMREDKRRRIASETMEIYAPIAGRLGLNGLKIELQDLCFKYLNPEEHDQLVEQMAETADERDAYIERVCAELNAHVVGDEFEAEVSGRAKHLWSTYFKMKTGNLAFEQVRDLLAFRILVQDVTQCYHVLGKVHGRWKPVPEHIKDYIAVPKPNGYQSLHTTVMGPENKRIEIQIRTQEMHRVAETGIAAHWVYKAGHLALSRDDLARITKIRELFDSAREVTDPDEFMEAVKIDLFQEDVYVFTPAGDVKRFPAGATTLDFAYAVHSEVGNHCVGARVDGRMVPLRYELQSGDSVEVLTGNHQHPRRDWLKLVKTSRALSKIRRYLRKQEQETGLRIGREMLESELKKYGKSIDRVVKDGSLKRLVKELNFRAVDALLISLAQGTIPLTQVVRDLVPEAQQDDKEERERAALMRILDRIRRRTNQSPVTIDGQEDVLVQFAKCCNPLPGEPVAGFVTRGRGITVHRRDCAQLLELEPERRLPVQWGGTARDAGHRGGVRVLCVDRPGLLANITKTCTDSGINITRAEVIQLPDQKAECTMQVQVQDVAELTRLIRRIAKIKGVIAVDRIVTG